MVLLILQDPVPLPLFPLLLPRFPTADPTGKPREKNRQSFVKTLESRGEELDEQIQQPEIASNIGKLMEIHKEKEAVDARLAELYERWEQLAEDM